MENEHSWWNKMQYTIEVIYTVRISAVSCVKLQFDCILINKNHYNLTHMYEIPVRIQRWNNHAYGKNNLLLRDKKQII